MTATTSNNEFKWANSAQKREQCANACTNGVARLMVVRARQVRRVARRFWQLEKAAHAGSSG